MTANHKLMTLGTFFCEAAAALAYNQLTLLDRPRATVNELSLEQLAAAAEEENDLPPAKRLKPIQLVSSIKDVILEGKQLREDEAERYRALVGPISLVSDAAAKLDAVSLGSFIPRLIASIASGAMAPSSFLVRLADGVVFNALSCLHNLRRGSGGRQLMPCRPCLLICQVQDTPGLSIYTNPLFSDSSRSCPRCSQEGHLSFWGQCPRGHFPGHGEVGPWGGHTGDCAGREPQKDIWQPITFSMLDCI